MSTSPLELAAAAAKGLTVFECEACALNSWNNSANDGRKPGRFSGSLRISVSM